MSRSLFTQTIGTGPDLVLLHGWSMNAAVWEPLAQHLAKRFRVTLIDLPGHGRSPMPDAFTLPALRDAVLAVAPQRAAWLGWSLGGMVAVEVAAHAPERVETLIVTACNPRFLSSTDWPHGVQPQVFDLFARELAADFAKTLQRFLLLVAFGAGADKAVLKQLRTRVLEQGAPDPAALNGGLALLQDEDLRARLGEVQCPTAFLLGERDTLVPATVAAQLPSLQAPGQLQVRVLKDAGHAPFLAAPDDFRQQLIGCLV